MKFGILGLGSIGSRHARNLLAMGHTVYGFDTLNQDRLTDWLALQTNGVLFVSPADVMRDIDIDALLVCTPTPLHTDGILLRDDIPVFVEKPIFDLTSRPARSLIEARRLVVGYNIRFHPLIDKVREWLPTIGEPIWGTFVVGQKNTKQYPDHVGLNWSHELDLAEHLLGPLDLSLSRESHNMVQISFNVERNGAPIFVHLDYLSEPRVRQFRIQGESRQRIEVDLEQATAFLLGATTPSGYAHVQDSIASGTESGFDESYRAEMQQFVRYVQSGETGHLATAQDALKIVDWFEEIVERRDK